jgi:tetratricopeptide (TPR) repeat protein
MVYSELGDYKSAEEQYLAALEDPAYLYPEKVYLNWAETLKRQGDMVGAEEKMRESVELNPRYARGYQELGRLLEGKGDDEGALQAYLKAYAGLSEFAELNLQIGEVYLRQGSRKQAIRYLQKVIELAPPESSEALRAQAFLQDLTAG